MSRISEYLGFVHSRDSSQSFWLEAAAQNSQEATAVRISEVAEILWGCPVSIFAENARHPLVIRYQPTGASNNIRNAFKISRSRDRHEESS